MLRARRFVGEYFAPSQRREIPETNLTIYAVIGVIGFVVVGVVFIVALSHFSQQHELVTCSFTSYREMTSCECEEVQKFPMQFRAEYGSVSLVADLAVYPIPAQPLASNISSRQFFWNGEQAIWQEVLSEYMTTISSAGARRRTFNYGVTFIVNSSVLFSLTAYWVSPNTSFCADIEPYCNAESSLGPCPRSPEYPVTRYPTLCRNRHQSDTFPINNVSSIHVDVAPGRDCCDANVLDDAHLCALTSKRCASNHTLPECQTFPIAGCNRCVRFILPSEVDTVRQTLANQAAAMMQGGYFPRVCLSNRPLPWSSVLSLSSSVAMFTSVVVSAFVSMLLCVGRSCRVSGSHDSNPDRRDLSTA